MLGWICAEIVGGELHKIEGRGEGVQIGRVDQEEQLLRSGRLLSGAQLRRKMSGPCSQISKTIIFVHELGHILILEVLLLYLNLRKQLECLGVFGEAAGQTDTHVYY
jgi:hypothetical protein